MARSRRLCTQAEREVVLVLSQDTGGAFEYLRQTFDKKVIYPNTVINVFGTGSVSRTMLADARRALSGRSRGFPNATYAMLVVDRDHDPGLTDVLSATEGHDAIEVFVSVPCIEYYFMLHFSSDRPAMNSFADLEPYLRQHEGFERYSKARNAVPVAQLADRADQARRNSAICRAACEADGAAGPRSDLDLLFEAFEAASEGGLARIRETRLSRLERRTKA